MGPRERAIALAVTVMLMTTVLAGCILDRAPDAIRPPQITLAPPAFETHVVEGRSIWEASCTITRLTSEDALTWKFSACRIERFVDELYRYVRGGSVLMVEGPVAPTANLTAYYIDKGGRPEGPDAGDILGDLPAEGVE